MADNINVTQGTGTNVATDNISGTHHQLIKLEYGDDGSATQVSETNPLPVVLSNDTVEVTGTVSIANGQTIGVSGDVGLSGSLPAGTNTLGKIAPNEYELAGNTAHVKKYYTNEGAVTDGIVWSPAAGKRWYITDIFVNTSASAVITLEDDLVAGDSVVWKADLVANSGWSHTFTTPLYSGEDAADLLITTSAGNVYVTVTGYEV
jgi:hypothetical protein